MSCLQYINQFGMYFSGTPFNMTIPQILNINSPPQYPRLEFLEKYIVWWFCGRHLIRDICLQVIRGIICSLCYYLHAMHNMKMLEEMHDNIVRCIIRWEVQ